MSATVIGAATNGTKVGVTVNGKTSEPWLRVHQPRANPRLRLFCLPYAGGTASLYRTWHQHLPEEIEVCAVQLPGRENRFREQPFSNLAKLVQMLLPNLLPHLDKPFALFGHSMGALIAYELAQQLQMGRHMPTHLIVSGRRSPILPDPAPPLHTLPGDDAFLAGLQRRYNNLPALMLSDAAFRDLFTPLLRADMTLVETYTYTSRPPLTCPLLALGGEEDANTSQAELRAWQSLTSADFAVQRFPGGHFYLNEQTQPLLSTLASYLA